MKVKTKLQTSQRQIVKLNKEVVNGKKGWKYFHQQWILSKVKVKQLKEQKGEKMKT